MYSLLKMGIFHCYLSLPEGRCHFVRWCLSLGIAGGIATFDEILWPTLSRWNCQTCLTHFYDSTRYFLVPTKKAGSLKSLHSQLVACCISIFHHENTRVSINVYPDDPDAQCLPVFAYIYPQDNPPNLYANKILTIWVYWIYIYIIFLPCGSRPIVVNKFEGNAEVVDALRDGAPRLPPSSSEGSEEGLGTRVLRRMSYDDSPRAGGWAANRGVSKGAKTTQKGKWDFWSLKTPGEFWKSEFLKYKDVRRKEIIYGILNFWE